MHPHRPLQNNPIARLNLPAPLWGPAEEPAEMAEPSPVEVPDFPPEAAAVSEGSVEFPGGEPATFSSGLADEARPVPGGNLSDRWAALDGDQRQDHPPPLTALERYRLENDRELLRTLAYQRHFVHGFRTGGLSR